MSLNDLCRMALESWFAEDSPKYEPSGGRRCAHADAAACVVGNELQGVVLFGSAARGDAVESSDIDLLIVTSPSIELNRGLYRRWDELRTDDTVRPHFVHLPDPPDSAGSIWFEVALVLQR